MSGVCPGGGRPMLKLQFDWHIIIYEEKTANLEPTRVALKWPKYATKTLIRYREDKVSHFCSINVVLFSTPKDVCKFPHKRLLF